MNTLKGAGHYCVLIWRQLNVTLTAAKHTALEVSKNTLSSSTLPHFKPARLFLLWSTKDDLNKLTIVTVQK